METFQEYPPRQKAASFSSTGHGEFQLLFAIDRVRAMAPDHPEWRRTQPFQAVLEGDNDALIASGDQGLLQIIAATHTGMTTEEFDEAVRTWITTARHPDTDRLYSDMIYTPMLELLEYLRARGFKTFIVSGGGIDFMRVFAEEVYGIPPEQVIGSSIKTEFAMTPGGPVIRRLPEVNFIDDKEGKPVGIHMHIGRRPILAGGNSDGDLQMLQWTAAGDGPSLCLLVHHTDAQREWAYDRDSHIGRLDAALDEAGAGHLSQFRVREELRRDDLEPHHAPDHVGVLPRHTDRPRRGHEDHAQHLRDARPEGTERPIHQRNEENKRDQHGADVERQEQPVLGPSCSRVEHIRCGKVHLTYRGLFVGRLFSLRHQNLRERERAGR
jgi:hypothetical protein